ncbi:MAG: alpha-glucosidase/alpha-galactosidase [Chloroflexi bacterium]|nr:alpha-glucosidase/alpha-galactosidase [Chloroflexota bacterium]
MSTTKVVLIGAASASFGPAMVADALLTQDLRGSTLTLVDLDGERLAVMAAYARRLNTLHDAGWCIEHTTDRCLALPGASFVITSVAVKRDELWKLDFAIPIRHGIKQVLGENGGPGGLSHSLRNIPIILDITRDMERLCPHALLLNFSNPESRIGLAVSRYTAQPFVGLCHGIGMGYDSASRITGIPVDDLVGSCGGLNHLGWFLQLRRKSTGEDVYPLLREADQNYDAAYLPLTRYLFHTFGLYPYPSDDHVGEYLSYAWEFCGLEGYDFEAADRHRARQWGYVQRVAVGEEKPALLRASGEFAFPIIAAMANGTETYIDAVNVRNDGYIENLPAWTVVEVPAMAGASGLRGLHVGALPAGIAAICNTQAHVQDLVVDAAVKGSRQLALQALLADPVVSSAEAAERTLDELLAVHAPYLPAFR